MEKSIKSITYLEAKYLYKVYQYQCIQELYSPGILLETKSKINIDMIVQRILVPIQPQILRHHIQVFQNTNNTNAGTPIMP